MHLEDCGSAQRDSKRIDMISARRGRDYNSQLVEIQVAAVPVSAFAPTP